MSDLVLPAFELDCREWLVSSPAEAGLDDGPDGAPVLAVLSSLVIDDDLREVTGALTVGLLDEVDRVRARPAAPGCAALILNGDAEPGVRRYVVPSPHDDRLALVAEFVGAGGSIAGPDGAATELGHRVETLMRSFRWQTG